MTPATSMLLGHRWLQVEQDRHIQMERESSTASFKPNCTARMIWLTCMS